MLTITRLLFITFVKLYLIPAKITITIKRSDTCQTERCVRRVLWFLIVIEVMHCNNVIKISATLRNELKFQ